MKIFKRIYYPILAIVFVVFIVFSFVNVNVASSSTSLGANFKENLFGQDKHIDTLSSYKTDGFDRENGTANAYKYIESKLLKGDSNDSISTKRTTTVVYNSKGEDIGDTTASFVTSNSVVKPTTTVQTSVLRDEVVLGSVNGQDDIYDVAQEFTNVITVIPGQDRINGVENKDSVLIMTNYDSLFTGATNNNSNVAVALEMARELLRNGSQYKNDIIFLFYEGGLQGNLGAYGFKEQFKGFDNIVDTIKVAVSFDSFGASGNLMMYHATENNSKIISQVSSITGGTYSSSLLNQIFNSREDVQVAVDIFDNAEGISFANIGARRYYNTILDNQEHLNQDLVIKKADTMNKFIDKFANSDLTTLSSDTSSVYFSYLGSNIISYSNTMSIVFGVILIALLLGIIVINQFKKSFNFISALMGAVCTVLAMAGAVAGMYLIYLLCGLLLSGFGVISLRALFSFQFMNVGVLIGGFIIAGALLVAMYIILKKIFGLKAVALVRGNTLLMAVVAIVASFAFKEASFIFVFVAFLSLVVMLINMLAKDKFKDKNGFSIEQLFLYAIPVVLATPIIIPAISVLSMTTATIMLPVICLLFMMMAGSILPYATLLQPALDKVAKKVPARRVRYEEVVVEKIEDKAKKGKFTEQTVKKVREERVKWNYKNRVGIALCSVIGAVVLILSAAFSSGAGSNIYSNVNTLDNYIYNNSIVYVYDGINSTKTLEISDMSLFKYVQKSSSLSGFSYNADKEAYTKDYYSTVISNIPTVTSADNVFTFNVYNEYSNKSVVKVTGASKVKTFKFNSKSHGGTEYVFENEDAVDEMTFNLPIGYGNFTMTADSAVSVVYEESYNNIVAVSNITEVSGFLVENSDFDIKTGLVFKLSA